MAKRKFPSGSHKFIAFPGTYAAVTVVESGNGGIVSRRKYADPYVVKDCNGATFVMPGSKLYDDPVAASIAATKLAQKYGVEADDFDDDEEEELEEDEEFDEDD